MSLDRHLCQREREVAEARRWAGIPRHRKDEPVEEPLSKPTESVPPVTNYIDDVAWTQPTTEQSFENLSALVCEFGTVADVAGFFEMPKSELFALSNRALTDVPPQTAWLLDKAAEKIIGREKPL